MARVLFIDSDAFILLAGARCLDAACTLLGFAPADCRRLAALAPMLRGRQLQARYPAGVLEAARQACGVYRPIEERPDDANFQALLALPGMDVGEASLYAHLIQHREAHLLSGDKRAMESLCSQPAGRWARDSVAGRVICLERILRLMVVAHGVKEVSRWFLDVIPSYATLRVVFSDANAADAVQCLGAIDSYLGELERATGPGFLL